MRIVFTVRMNKELADYLGMLAKKSQRSRAGVVRWLIQNAALDTDLVLREASGVTSIKESPAKPTVLDKGH